MEFSQKRITVGTDKKNDLSVTLELTGNLREIEITSKFEKKYGEAIRKAVDLALNNYDIKGAKVFIEDLGAYDFAVIARVETAIKRALKEQGGE